MAENTALTAPTALDLAAFALWDAKRVEDEARAARIACEEALIALVGAKEEGTTRADGAFYSVKTVGKLTRKLDESMLGRVVAQVPREIWDRVIVPRPELKVAELKKLATENPPVYALLAQCIETRPAKTAVSVDLMKTEAAQEAA